MQSSAMQPVVAIHDSELTRALESQPASGTTPTGAGTTGFQWWPNNWHYFVMPESVEEALRSDGTAFQVVSDANISAGQLVVNGAPQYPIVISLAAEAADNSEIGPLTNYVAAGGVLLVGSSAFTRNTNGTTRGDFAFANALGVHMVTAGLNNWGTDSTFTKLTNHAIVTHIPSGTNNWYMPLSAEDIPLGTSPTHPVNHNHLVWQVQAGDATVIANGDNYPYLLIKPFGKGYFIYHAAMQPLIGHSGWDSGMYAYVVFRKAIEWAFANANQPVPRLSPWPYPYDAAAMFRHDMEDIEDLITNIESSAHAEANVGAKGDYYFCTGAMRVNFSQNSRTNNIASLQRAISLYGATIGPHNGGLPDVGNPSLATNTYDYWHWGPDEVLDLTNPPPTGYASGGAYGFTSISNAFGDLQKWGETNSTGQRFWASPYFNSTREGSKQILQQLGVLTVGEEKLGPFPHWTLSTATSGKRYPMVSLPVSDWYYGNTVAQSLENYYNGTASVAAAVDFYYNLGALIDIYSHSSSAGGPSVGYPDGLGGIAIQSEPNTQQYSVNYTMAKPRLWSANATSLYGWWLQRSNVQITATTTPVGNRLATILTIQGATQTNTAVEFLLPSVAATNFQVLENGVLVDTNSYRTNGLVLKCLVGTTVTNVQILYYVTTVPIAQNDAYSVQPGTTLTVGAPGVLANDSVGNGTNLTAVPVSGPSHSSAFNLNASGAFSYTPVVGFTGTDSFTYLANDGLTNSDPATVTITVAAAPAILSGPVGLTNLAGTTASFSVTATSSVPITYLWLKNGTLLANGGNISGATTSNLVVTSVAATDAGSYSVVVTSSSGSITSAPALLTVLAPPTLTSQPASQAVTTSGNAGFSVTVVGSVPLTYQWLCNGTNLSDGGQFGGTATSGLSVTNVQPGNAGNYAVVVTNAFGAVTSSVAVLTVIPAGNCTAAPSGLIGWWPGDGNANDIAFARNGTLMGGATATAVGVVGQAFNFDGTNNYVSIPNSTALQPTNLTIEAWVRFSSLDSSYSSNPGHQYIVFKQNNSSANFEGFSFGKDRYNHVPHPPLTNGDVFYLDVSSSGGTQTAEADSAITISTNVWYHVAGVRGPNIVQIYVNGQLQGQSGVSFPQNYGSLPVYFGSSGQNFWDGKLAGQLDEVSIYNRALSSNEIAAIYNAGASGKCKLPPVITNQPASLTVTAGNSATFTVGVSGNLFTVYQWQFNGTNIANANTNTFTLSNVQPANAGNYTVIVTNAAGAVTSATATLTVNFNSAPVITTPPASLSVNVSSNAVFTVGATGTAPLSYQWFFNATNAVGLNTNSLTLTNVQATNAGNYSVVITNGSGAVTSAPALLAVKFPPVITNQPVSLAVIVSNNATFRVGVSGDAPLSYQWFFNATNAVGLNTNSLTLTNVQATNAGNYSVVITNTSGAVTSAPALLAIKFPPVITNQPVSLAVIVSNNATFTVGVSGDAPLSYQWFFNTTNAVGLNTNVLALVNVQAADAGNYSVAITNASGAVTSTPAILTVNFPPVITNQPASLAVIVSNNAFFTVGVSGDAPLSYQWFFNTTNAVGLNTNVLALANVQAADAGNYSVVITNASGAVTSTPAILTVNFPPVITNQPARLAVIVGNNASFTVGVSGDAPLSYQWFFNTTNAVGLNTNVLALANVQAADAGNYSVVITNASGAVTSTPAILTVNFPPVITNQPASLAVIIGNNASFTVGVTGDAPLIYQWFFNATNAIGLNTNSLTLTSVQAASAGGYSVVITNASGAVTSAPAVLTVNFPSGYNQILGQLLSEGDVQLSFAGVASGAYALDRSFSLSSPDWLPLLTNTTDTNGLVFFTNTPDTSTNNFWRIRSVP